MTSLRLLVCALLVVAACAKSAESRGVEGSSTESAEPTSATASPPTTEPAGKIEDTVARPEVPEATGEPATADRDPVPAAAAQRADTAKLAGHAAVGKSNTRIVAMGSNTVAETGEYKLVLAIPDGAKSGVQDSVKIKITPKKGWKLNKEFPNKLKVSPPAGVKVAKANQNQGDAVSFSEHGGAEWHVKFTPDSTGRKDFGGEFRFAVCTETTCVPKKEKLAFVVNVK